MSAAALRVRSLASGPLYYGDPLRLSQGQTG